MNEAALIAAGIAVVGAVVRLMKTDRLTIALANLGLPPVPKLALPWIALVLGYAYALLVERQLGKPWDEAALKALVEGVIVGGGAAYAHDLGKAVPGVKKALGVLLIVVPLSMATSSCTPDARRALLETVMDAAKCAVAHQDLADKDILKVCSVDAIDADRILRIVGESRERSAKAALIAETRASAAKCVEHVP